MLSEIEKERHETFAKVLYILFLFFKLGERWIIGGRLENTHTHHRYPLWKIVFFKRQKREILVQYYMSQLKFCVQKKNIVLL